MNKAAILAGLLTLLWVLLTAVPQNDWQVFDLKGKVKSVVGDTESMTFNPQGFLETTVTGSPEYPDGDGVYTYDQKGRLILRIEKDSDGYEIYRSTYVYNDRGLLQTQLNTDSYGSDQDEYTYSSAGQMTWKKTTCKNGSLLEAIEYLYNKAGKQQREIYYDDEMQPWQIKTMDYDQKKTLKEIREYTLPDTLNPKKITKYDPQGNRIEQTEFRKDRSSITHKMAYDENGNLSSLITIPEVTMYHAPKRILYVYDKKGNWTKKQEYLGSKLIDTRERSITYY